MCKVTRYQLNLHGNASSCHPSSLLVLARAASLGAATVCTYELFQKQLQYLRSLLMLTGTYRVLFQCQQQLPTNFVMQEVDLCPLLWKQLQFTITLLVLGAELCPTFQCQHQHPAHLCYKQLLSILPLLAAVHCPLGQYYVQLPAYLAGARISTLPNFGFSIKISSLTTFLKLRVAPCPSSFCAGSGSPCLYQKSASCL